MQSKNDKNAVFCVVFWRILVFLRIYPASNFRGVCELPNIKIETHFIRNLLLQDKNERFFWEIES